MSVLMHLYDSLREKMAAPSAEFEERIRCLNRLAEQAQREAAIAEAELRRRRRKE